MKVLAVAEIGCFRHSLTMLLEQLGHTVVPAGRAEEALEAATSDRDIRCVLTDLELRGTDGFDLFADVKMYRRESHLPDLPFFLITTHKPGQSYKRHLDLYLDAAAAGFSSVLAKPVNFDELKAALETVPLDSSQCRLSTDELLQSVSTALDQVFDARNRDAIDQLRAKLERTVDRIDDWMIDFYRKGSPTAGVQG